MNTQKIQTSTRGFTLVELIVVITILVILGTIAFLNLGGMSSSARDSQRTSDINQINTQVMTLQAKNGTTYINMLSGTVANTLTGNPQIAGSGVTSTQYQGGDVNYTVLGVDKNKFKDPVSGDSYKMGATDRAGGSYELAAKLEETSTALVMGTYIARGTTTTASGVVDNAAKTIKITTGLGLFRVNDWIKDTVTGGSGQITSISGDLTTLYYAGNITSATGVVLMQPEIAGLVATKGATTTAVTNKGSNLPY